MQSSPRFTTITISFLGRAKSKFPFVLDMKNDTGAAAIIRAFEQIFDLVGPPECVVSDNGPPFTSY